MPLLYQTYGKAQFFLYLKMIEVTGIYSKKSILVECNIQTRKSVRKIVFLLCTLPFD